MRACDKLFNSVSLYNLFLNYKIQKHLYIINKMKYLLISIVLVTIVLSANVEIASSFTSDTFSDADGSINF